VAGENASQQVEKDRGGRKRRRRALAVLRVWFERGCTPSWRSGVMAVGWAVMWAYVVVGALIIRAIDESVRQSPDAEDAGQGPLSFIDGTSRDRPRPVAVSCSRGVLRLARVT
jgi:hypothetical protein